MASSYYKFYRLEDPDSVFARYNTTSRNSENNSNSREIYMACYMITYSMKII